VLQVSCLESVHKVVEIHELILHNYVCLDCGGIVALTTRHPLSAKVGTFHRQAVFAQSVGIVRLRTQAMEFSLVLYLSLTSVTELLQWHMSTLSCLAHVLSGYSH
jgi:hypothetical protein